MAEISTNAGEAVELKCVANLDSISPDDVSVEVFYGKFDDTNKLVDSSFIKMEQTNKITDNKYEYSAKINMNNGGNYGYTFRIMPTNPLLINNQDIGLCKWLTN